MSNLTDVVNSDRLSQLKELLGIIAEAIDRSPGARDLAQLSRQYRETLKEIEEIEGGTADDDELGAILAERRSDGKPSSVR